MISKLCICAVRSTIKSILQKAQTLTPKMSPANESVMCLLLKEGTSFLSNMESSITKKLSDLGSKTYLVQTSSALI